MTVGAGKRKLARLSGKRVALIDLDDTLYRQHLIPQRVKEAIQRYMVTKLGISEDEVQNLNSAHYATYGTTMAGLVADGHKIDYDDWHAAVHHQALDYNALLKPDIVLRELLFSMDMPKYILTNADRKHAELCLTRLGIRDCFQGVFDFEWAQAAGAAAGLLTPSAPVLCKPSKAVYQLALDTLGVQASECLFFDDSVRNIAAAHDVGLMTVLVGSEALVPGADLVVRDMHQLPSVAPELFDQPGMVHDTHRTPSGIHSHAVDLASEQQQSGSGPALATAVAAQV